MKKFLFIGVCLLFLIGFVRSDELVDEPAATLDVDLGASREGSRTDDEVVKREEEAIKLDGLNVAQLRELREKSEKFTFQTEVNRMMKLIINSLYRNKEIFLRELISNASDALDKIRMLSLTDKNVLDTNPELNIKIKADKEAQMLHITDTGIGMTKQDLINNLGTIAKSGTAEFLSKMQDASSSQDMNDMIGQFGVGFYSAFLVADKVIVTTKHNDDKQYIWESDSSSFSIVEDPREDSLKRGTTVSLQLKPEAKDFLEEETIRNLVKKYSQFINFPIYLWASHTEQVEEADDDVPEEKEPKEDKVDGEDEAAVEEDKEEKEKTKKVDKTVWDWELLNDSKPIWTKKPAEVEESEYEEFYKALTKDTNPALTHVHFVAEGEVTFKSLLYVPKVQPSESFNRYGTKTDNIKLYVRRVFITDEFNDMMPSYLNFIRGVVDSDDLPLNVSRENLQQHKLIKVIKKKLVRKILDALKKIPDADYEKFWKEYSTNIKLGVIEDPTNRTRLAKLLQFLSSNSGENTFLSDYVKRMKLLRKVKKHLKRLKKVEGAIKLVGGRGEYEGNVEILHEGRWGAICDDEWDSAEAKVICNQLGYKNGTSKYTGNAYFGPAKRKFWMDNIYCEGSEKEITSCRFDGWGSNDCDVTEAAGVICDEPPVEEEKKQENLIKKETQMKKLPDSLNLRIVGGRIEQEGRVEVKTDYDNWEPICGDGWSILEAMVVCKTLNYGYANNAFQTDYFGGNLSNHSYANIKCRGNEISFSHCLYDVNSVGMCPGKDLAAVSCTSSLPDLVIDHIDIMRTAHLEDRQLFFLQCAMEENCLASEAYRIQRENPNGWHLETRRLLRFTARIFNAGTADFRPFIPKHLWEWHMCHMHYHSMEIFATFDIFNNKGIKVAEGHKASFCLEDNQCLPGIEPSYNCNNFGDQGISVNCSDIYKYTVDCQWIDISDIKPGVYTMKVVVNPEFKVAEMSYENNAALCTFYYSETYGTVTNCTVQRP
ncbi:endoplasmin-like [Coccinella septempunctata]|uniref:endoplasmin-like n=1 Tax=Coccinella septempunctata TaxID=41139 RepID=UPI001D08A1D7|nr:endoplasmin-like [Coccinella septempunctata]